GHEHLGAVDSRCSSIRRTGSREKRSLIALTGPLSRTVRDVHAMAMSRAAIRVPKSRAFTAVANLRVGEQRRGLGKRDPFLRSRGTIPNLTETFRSVPADDNHARDAEQLRVTKLHAGRHLRPVVEQNLNSRRRQLGGERFSLLVYGRI